MVDDFPFPGEDADFRQQFTGVEGNRKTNTGITRKSEKIMVKRKVSYENIEQELKAGRCCSKRCIQSILTVPEIYRTRNWFLEKTREAQGQFLLNFFQVARRAKGQKTIYEYNVEKKYVCQKAWIFSHGIAYGRYVVITIVTCIAKMKLLITKRKKLVRTKLKFLWCVRGERDLKNDPREQRSMTRQLGGFVFHKDKPHR